MTLAIKTTKKKTASHLPPREIRENTKARRAWLAAKLAEISLKPNTVAKIVGAGSYQEVSEWTLTEMKGRLRHRGVCQVCGREQVVEEKTGTLVLHGYKRPGYGSIHSECPGIGKAPLNVTDVLTRKILADVTAQQQRLERQLVKDEARATEATSAKYGPEATVEGPALSDRPKKRKVNGGPYTSEALEAAKWDRAAQIVWANEWPITAAYVAAVETRDGTQRALWSTKNAVSFYTDLLAMKITGTPLRPEVVA